MTKKLQSLYGLLKGGFEIANLTNNVPRSGQTPDVDLLLKKGDQVKALNEMFIRDVAEKFILERHGVAVGKTVVQRRFPDGRLSDRFIINTVDIHPSTRFTDEATPHSPMVFDIFGQVHDRESPQDGLDTYHDLDETRGDRLMVCTDQPGN